MSFRQALLNLNILTADPDEPAGMRCLDLLMAAIAIMDTAKVDANNICEAVTEEEWLRFCTMAYRKLRRTLTSGTPA